MPFRRSPLLQIAFDIFILNTLSGIVYSIFIKSDSNDLVIVGWFIFVLLLTVFVLTLNECRKISNAALYHFIVGTLYLLSIRLFFEAAFILLGNQTTRLALPLLSFIFVARAIFIAAKLRENRLLNIASGRLSEDYKIWDLGKELVLAKIKPISAKAKLITALQWVSAFIFPFFIVFQPTRLLGVGWSIYILGCFVVLVSAKHFGLATQLLLWGQQSKTIVKIK